MIRYRLLFLGALYCVVSSASAGIFSDTEARQQINQLDSLLNSRISTNETALARLDAAIAKLENSFKQQLQAINEKQIGALLDLQTSIDALKAEVRRLRGQNEELAHNLQAAEKRQQDFYVDLDARMRRIETAQASSSERVPGKKNASDTPLTESMQLEDALSFYKTERYNEAIQSFQVFLKSYPKSERVADVRYWMGNAYFVIKDYAHSLESYQLLLEQFNNYAHLSEVMFNIADCQDMLDNTAAAKTTLQRIIARFPNTEAADKAKKQLSSIK